jgi:hypothetical protein
VVGQPTTATAHTRHTHMCTLKVAVGTEKSVTAAATCLVRLSGGQAQPQHVRPCPGQQSMIRPGIHTLRSRMPFQKADVGSLCLSRCMLLPRRTIHGSCCWRLPNKHLQVQHMSTTVRAGSHSCRQLPTSPPAPSNDVCSVNRLLPPLLLV